MCHSFQNIKMKCYCTGKKKKRCRYTGRERIAPIRVMFRAYESLQRYQQFLVSDGTSYSVQSHFLHSLQKQTFFFLHNKFFLILLFNEFLKRIKHVSHKSFQILYFKFVLFIYIELRRLFPTNNRNNKQAMVNKVCDQLQKKKNGWQEIGPLSISTISFFFLPLIVI